MDWKHEHDELPEELAESLRSLGVVKAPPELWHRVVLATDGLSTAPEALRTRIAPAVRDAAYPDAPVLPFRRRMASAAAMLLVVGFGMLSIGSDQTAPAGVLGPRELVRDYLRASLKSDVPITTYLTHDELSAATRHLIAE